MKAHALSFVAPSRVEITEVELPETGPGQTLVATRYSGISSGTELLAYRGQIDASLPLDDTLGALTGTFAYPFAYGYSCVGQVERGDERLPSGSWVLAFHPHQDRFVARTDELVPLGDCDPRIGTLFPLVETALQISLDAGQVHHERVVVIGLGAVGMLTAALLRRAGAEVIGVEPSPWRRKAAAEFGLRTVETEGVVDVVAEETRGAGVPLVVEVSGNPQSLETALGLLAHEGTALVASWYGTKEVRLPLGGAFHRRRLSIRSTQVSSIPSHLSVRWTVERRRATVQRLLEELPLSVLATHEFPFRDAATAFDVLDRGEDGLLHAALSYDEAGAR
ncbi:MAG: zinc-binding alcohol dehydrogenase [Actinobacteria bacterium]|nr:zinc-binding alcohol dehydrogenase [Actinomycetota bacterium]